ncbi:hypothetical protein QBC34DRAFT_430453 [Podospora aff. communis PSN243]|uniref:Roadblock/LAMTOR2 domain-containing protein n=1 Tax=Podospora aff. communis PSN243 TaxID=3040156 RepID=A0AAV9G9N8_9PEZI|nr:hypothetical protein QBC34DRAFT_430453 [Podospora aff. communis PSN243]
MSNSSNPSLVSLAKEILRHASILEDGLPSQPSFDPGSRANYHDIFNTLLMQSRTALIEASNTMLTLARGPTGALHSIITTDRTAVAVLRAIHELRIAHAVPLSGESITISSPSTKIGVHPTPLRRIFSYAYTMHIFRHTGHRLFYAFRNGDETLAYTACFPP